MILATFKQRYESFLCGGGRNSQVTFFKQFRPMALGYAYDGGPQLFPIWMVSSTPR